MRFFKLSGPKKPIFGAACAFFLIFLLFELVFPRKRDYITLIAKAVGGALSSGLLDSCLSGVCGVCIKPYQE